MQRREFLVKASQGAITIAFSRALLTAQNRATSASVPVMIRTLEREILDLMEVTRAPGVSIALIRDGKLHWRRGFGIRRAGAAERIDHETVFHAASVSKTVFAYAVMRLVERGVIDLDTPLTRYSRFRILDGDPRLDLITARHVLSHSSGLQNWRSAANPLSIRFTPGERYLYSGEGYSYLQSVVTELTGRVDPERCGKFEAGLTVCATDFDSYMRAHVLRPLGMDSSGYVWTPKMEQHAAYPHDDQGRLLDLGKPSDIEAARYAAAGGLLTTPTDYAKFVIHIINPKSNERSRLQDSAINVMLRPQIKGGQSPESWRALGWEVVQTDTEDILLHGGNTSGFHAFAAASRTRKTGYMIMTNGDGGANLILKLILGDTTLNQLLMG
jgi:CubicO group peptidase (beta-lactamase class C family)